MLSPVIVWLRQDLRLADHPALIAAATQGPVIFLYVLDDETPGEWKIGAASRWWLHRSLEALRTKVPLVLRRGAAHKVIAEVLKETGASALHFTRDLGFLSSFIPSCIACAAKSKRSPCFLCSSRTVLRPN